MNREEAHLLCCDLHKQRYKDGPIIIIGKMMIALARACKQINKRGFITKHDKQEKETVERGFFSSCVYHNQKVPLSQQRKLVVIADQQ